MNSNWLRKNYKTIEIIIWFIASPLLLFIPFLRIYALISVLLNLAFRPLITGIKLQRTSLDIPILLILMMSALTVFTSIDVSTSLYKLIQIGMYLALFFTIVNHIDLEKELRQIVTLALIVALGLSAIAIFLTIVPFVKSVFFNQSNLKIFNYLAKLQVSLLDPGVGYQNSLAGFILFLVPVAFSLAFFSEWKNNNIGKIFMITAFIVMLIVPFITSSRGALFGLLAASLALVVIKWPKIGLIALVVIILSSVIFYPQIKNYLLTDFTFVARTYIWKSSVEMIRQFPFTGVGLGTYEIAYNFFKLPGSSIYTPFSKHAHNIFLNPASEGGYLSLIVFLWLLFAVFLAAYRSQKESDGYLYALSLGLFGSFVAFLFQGLIDSVNAGVRLGMLFWFMLSLVAVTQKLGSGKNIEDYNIKKPAIKLERGRNRLSIISVIILVVIIGASLGYKSLCSGLMNNLGNIYLYRAENENINKIRKNDYYQEASTYFKYAINFNKANPYPYRNLATVFIKTGQIDKAQTELEKSLTLKEDDAVSHNYLAEVFKLQGRDAAAQKELREAKKLTNAFLGKPHELETRLGLID